jgi:hypothetical protein
MPKPCNLKTVKTQKSESCSAPYELFTADEVPIIVRLHSPNGRPIARRARDPAIEIGTRSHGEEFAGIAQHVSSCRIAPITFARW